LNISVRESQNTKKCAKLNLRFSAIVHLMNHFEAGLHYNLGFVEIKGFGASDAEFARRVKVIKKTLK
jgi:hypothetical protein